MMNPRNFPQMLLRCLALVASWKVLPYAQAQSVANKPALPAVEMCLAGMTMGKPPLKHLAFNITVRNNESRSRWFLFPAALYEQGQSSPPGMGVDGAQVSSSLSAPGIKVIRFSGSVRLQPESAGGFKAILLPARSEVSITSFDIGYWAGNLSPGLAIKVLITDEVLVNGMAAARWVGDEMISRGSGPVSEKDFKAAHSHFTGDRGEVPVAFRGKKEIVMENALATKCAASVK
jgi:hypothetical protein